MRNALTRTLRLPPNGWSNCTSKRALNLKIGAKRVTCSARPVAWSADQGLNAVRPFGRMTGSAPSGRPRLVSPRALPSVRSTQRPYSNFAISVRPTASTAVRRTVHFKLKNSVKSPIEGDWDRIRAPALRCVRARNPRPHRCLCCRVAVDRSPGNAANRRGLGDPPRHHHRLVGHDPGPGMA
jgi:hypothetical protein